MDRSRASRPGTQVRPADAAAVLRARASTSCRSPPKALEALDFSHAARRRGQGFEACARHSHQRVRSTRITAYNASLVPLVREHWVSAFLSSRPPYSLPQQAGETGRGMVVVLNAALQKRDDVAQLGTLEDELRLRLAAQAAGCAAFDWNVAAGTIRWDGATDILPLHLDSRQCAQLSRRHPAGTPRRAAGGAGFPRAAHPPSSWSTSKSPARWARSISP